MIPCTTDWFCISVGSSSRTWLCLDWINQAESCHYFYSTFIEYGGRVIVLNDKTKTKTKQNKTKQNNKQTNKNKTHSTHTLHSPHTTQHGLYLWSDHEVITDVEQTRATWKSSRMRKTRVHRKHQSESVCKTESFDSFFVREMTHWD